MMIWDKLLSATRLRDLMAEKKIDVGTSRKKKPNDTADRTEFERDHDRTVFSTPFRRLQDKAQVFPLEPIDAVRTRLTHTVEVSSVARGLARSVASDLVKKHGLNPTLAPNIVAIAETCGLLHDMGNPPFGHSGEQAIRDWFAERFQKKDPGLKGIMRVASAYRNDLTNFEGNAQTLRLVSKLQLLLDLDGLNLTAGTFSAACKYTADSRGIGKITTNGKKHHESSKLGYFASEADLVEKVRAETGTGTARNPISFLVEASDDLVYAIVDVEDGIKKGIVSWDFVHKTLKDCAGKPAQKECLKPLNEKLKNAPFLKGDHARGEAAIQYLRTSAIAFGVKAVRKRFGEVYTDIMAGNYHGELLYDSDATDLYRTLKEEIGYKRVYTSGETLRLELLGRKVIHDLLDIFWTADQAGKNKAFTGKAYALLSHNYRLIYEEACKAKAHPPAYLKALLITDYICGMTDSYALNLHRELFHG